MSYIIKGKTTRMDIKNCFWGVLTLFISIQALADSSQYIIGVDDVLEIAFWQDPELNVTVKVGQDGSIALPVGGTVSAAGLTTEKLAEKIVEQISIFNRRITRANVKVTEFGSRKVYVLGNVSTPGKYTFEVMPNLWGVIMEAGGPTENANLSDVMIIRQQDGKEQSINVDLGELLKNNDLKNIPEMYPGDNVYVPAVIGNVPSSGIQTSQTAQNILFIYGEVRTPGVYTFNKELNILEALVTAGGPTPVAKLNEVKVIRKSGAYSSVLRVNVDRYAHESVPSFFIVKGGDAIYVPAKRTFQTSVAFNFFSIFAAAVLTAVAYNFVLNR
jgi:protein involved in polysaccharide export with SLBB domain